MTGAERGLVLLTSHLGNPERKVLTAAQLRTLAQRARQMPPPQTDRELKEQDLYALGYNREMSARIAGLLEEEAELDAYLKRAAEAGCQCVARIHSAYAQRLSSSLGADAPACLWVKGDVTLLNTPAVALVGSRELRDENRDFAQAVGTYAAKQGWTLVSGNARGADRTAQEACLAGGGRVISIVADALESHRTRDGILYVSELDFDQPFSAQRALSRNRCIHAMGQLVFVAQSDLKKGGTWQGTAANLRYGWSPVLCFRDESPAGAALAELGAALITKEELCSVRLPRQDQMTMF